MTRYKKIFIILALAFLASHPAFSSEWVLYENARFGTQAKIPSVGFEPLSAPENGDGQRWVRYDGVGTFAIFGSFLTTSDNFSDYEALQLAWAQEEGIDVTYSNNGDNWFVISGLKAGSIFYRRYELSIYCDTQIVDGFTATYPSYVRDIFDSLISHISLSLGNSKRGLAAGCP